MTLTTDTIGGFPIVSPDCLGCGKPLLLENAWSTDGCLCNSPLGVNSMNETRWRLLMQLQQDQSRALCWQRIEYAPKTGEHILVRNENAGWGICGGKRQMAHAVVHWFNDPEEPGFYLSLGGSEDDHPFQATHWRPL